jgi:hypothetical protein
MKLVIGDKNDSYGARRGTHALAQYQYEPRR